MSPRLIPRRPAVSGWISTHELQSTFETGSGSSCSHGLFAPRPSPSVGERYVTRWKSPVLAVVVAGTGGTAVVAAGRAAIEPLMIPFASAAASVCVLPPPG